MRLAGQWAEVIGALPPGWVRVRLALLLEDARDAERAAPLLGPASAGRSGTRFLVDVHPGPEVPGPGPEVVRRCLQRLDEEGIEGRLELVGAEAPAERGAVRGRRAALADQWDALVARLPPDWSDLYAEVELDSTDFLDRGALLLSPVNPARYGGARGFRFRSSKRFGYGASAAMTRRCFERLDGEAITGQMRILRVLSDTDVPESTPSQGPVFRIGGRSV